MRGVMRSISCGRRCAAPATSRTFPSSSDDHNRFVAKPPAGGTAGLHTVRHDQRLPPLSDGEIYQDHDHLLVRHIRFEHLCKRGINALQLLFEHFEHFADALLGVIFR